MNTYFTEILKTIIPANIRLDEDVLKTSWARPIYLSYSYIFRRRLQDVLIVLVIRLQDFFKTFSRHRRDVFKTSSRCLAKTSWSLQDVLQKMSSRHHQVKLLLLARFQDVFETYSIRFWDVLARRLSTERFV